MIIELLTAFMLASALAAASSPAAWQRSDGLRADRIARGLDSPLFVTAPPGDPRLFVVEQPGRIRVMREGRLLPRPFLDITDRVGYGGERGLLGLAFHPLYARNGWFFVNYTDRNGDTQVVRFKAGALTDVADIASATPVISVDQPFSNHNGGMIAFAPDGRLWIGMGDSGSGGDPQGNGQSTSTLLGKLLRIDVDSLPYRVPSDNPFARAGDGLKPIWATGLRNPWRFSFDRGSSLVYIGDVGQNAYEEIDVADSRTPGLNYGWNRREGLHAFRAGMIPGNALQPALEYGHSDGCSVTGGYVYRGRALPALQGTYFFSDYCSGWLRSFRWAGGRATDLREWRVGPLGSVTSMGEDAAGELYVTSSDGAVYRLVPAAPPSPRR